MTLLSDKEFTKLTQLCRINCSPQEKEVLSHKIQRVVSYIDLLDELDTKGVTPCYQVTPTQPKVLREDEEGPLLSQEEFLSNAPSSIGGMIKVPAVMKTST
jgi:aspartyl-tRNA(Asn)/glutamyl-tRNA(Gln) amidotransferase subunit C